MYLNNIAYIVPVLVLIIMIAYYTRPGINSFINEQLFRRNKSKRLPGLVLKRYIRIQAFGSAALLFATLLFSYYLEATQLAVIAVFILVTVLNIRAILRQKNRVFAIEFLRLFVVGLFVYSYIPNEITAHAIMLVLTVPLLAYEALRLRYNRYFFS